MSFYCYRVRVSGQGFRIECTAVRKLRRLAGDAGASPGFVAAVKRPVVAMVDDPQGEEDAEYAEWIGQNKKS